MVLRWVELKFKVTLNYSERPYSKNKKQRQGNNNPTKDRQRWRMRIKKNKLHPHLPTTWGAERTDTNFGGFE